MVEGLPPRALLPAPLAPKLVLPLRDADGGQSVTLPAKALECLQARLQVLLVPLRLVAVGVQVLHQVLLPEALLAAAAR